MELLPHVRLHRHNVLSHLLVSWLEEPFGPPLFEDKLGKIFLGLGPRLDDHLWHGVSEL